MDSRSQIEVEAGCQGTAAADHAGPGLILHHVGHAVREIAPAAERYVHTFGYSRATGMIHDPLQTALVQFLSLPGERAYLELVAPDGPESRLTRTAERRPGLHHLCYTCGPMDGAIEHLRENGLLLFSDPQPAVAFGNRLICWMMGGDGTLVELIERREPGDACIPR